MSQLCQWRHPKKVLGNFQKFTSQERHSRILILSDYCFNQNMAGITHLNEKFINERDHAPAWKSNFWVGHKFGSKLWIFTDFVDITIDFRKCWINARNDPFISNFNISVYLRWKINPGFGREQVLDQGGNRKCSDRMASQNSIFLIPKDLFNELRS